MNFRSAGSQVEGLKRDESNFLEANFVKKCIIDFWASFSAMFWVKFGFITIKFTYQLQNTLGSCQIKCRYFTAILHKLYFCYFANV